MSLKFLAKKSWHTTNLSNVEKVWIQEQKAAEENKRMGDLQKQIQEERQIQELRQLQVANGHSVKAVDTTLDWMYEGPSAQQQEQTSEEYLLGKIYKPTENPAAEIKQLNKDPGSLWMNKISTKNDTFTRMHEDPLLTMKRNEKASRESVLNNPVKMARIRHAIATELEQKDAEKTAKKEAKKARKEEKRSKRDRSRSRERPVEDRSSRRERSRSRERERPRERSWSRERDRPRERSRSRDGDRRYGLISKDAGESRRERDYLGPRPELLSSKAARDAKEADARHKPRETAKGMSEEEKARRLAEMMRDAAVNDEMRFSRHKSGRPGDREEARARADPAFLQSMRSEVYSKAGGGIEDRLKQNRHYMQKNDDLDSHGFMKR